MIKLLHKIFGCLAILIWANNLFAETLSTEFNTNTSGHNGAYFNITAKSKDVYVSGFDLYMTGNGTVTAFYKEGSYVGHEMASGDWTTLGSEGIQSTDMVTPIPIGGVTIPAGETYGFYLFSTTNIRYVTVDPGVQENFSNADIEIFANRTNGSIFGAPSSRVFSGSVHYSVKELTTTFVTNNANRGNYVDITANSSDIHISGFDVNFHGTDQEVSVHYKKGTYKGSETTSADWLFLGAKNITGTSGNATELDVGGIVVPAGETYGFAFYAGVAGGIRYTNSTGANENYSNDDLAIFSDTAIGPTLFTDTTANRVWNGRVHYTTPKSIGTTTAGGTVQEGSFFDVTAKSENVHISSFDINAHADDEKFDVWYRKDSYVGNEDSSTGWTLLGTTQLSGLLGVLSEIPIGGITVPAGETYGFLIHSPTCSLCVSYTNTGSPGNFGNSDLAIFAGASRAGSDPFSGALFSPRIWNGRIHYNVKEGESCFIGLATNGNVFSFCL
jgi:hypothetical protein